MQHWSQELHIVFLAQHGELKNQLMDLLNKDYIQHDESLWGVPIIFKKKKDGI